MIQSQSIPAKKAWEEKIRPSEQKYKERLMKKYGIGESDIVHGSGGFPDWMLVTPKSELLFFEVKPKTGKKNLNDKQIKAVRILLKSHKCKVFIVKYHKVREDVEFDPPEELTAEKLDEMVANQEAKHSPADSAWITTYLKIGQRNKAVAKAKKHGIILKDV